MSDKSKPKSLKDQLAPLREKLKVDELKANQAREEERRAEKQAQKQAKRTGQAQSSPAPRSAPPESLARAKGSGAGGVSAPQSSGAATAPADLSDAELVEFWRAAAGTVAINDKGREVQEPKRRTSAPGTAPEPPKPTPQDQTDFSAWLDNLSEEQAATIAYQKEGKTPPPGRAISKDRVLLEGLAPDLAHERLQRFLKAARARGGSSVSVSSGADPALRGRVRGWLEAAREVAFVEESPEGGLWRVTLNR